MKVLVTGGGTGIGKAVAEAVVERGGSVVIVGRRREVLESIARGRMKFLVCDVAFEADREGLLSKAKKLLGGLDGFVHSAGAVVHEPPGHISEEALRSQIEVNLVAPLRLGEQALSVLPRGGSMVFISSTLAMRPIVTSAAYSASKAGMLQVMKTLALAGAPKGIRANAVLPGLVDTEMIRELRLSPGEKKPNGKELKRRLDAQMKALASLHPLGRLGTPEDVAGTVLHLLTASWVTGSEIVVDGGLLLRE
ncbi:MAG: SDR family NAD(P)-dependent oxidoreductase [Myxococcaceae bacterium]